MIIIIGRKIILRKGDNEALRIIIKDYKGKDLPLSRSDKLTMRIRYAMETTPPIYFTKVAEKYKLRGDKNGVVSDIIVFRNSEIINLPAGDYNYDLILEHGTKRFTVIPDSTLTIQESVSLSDLDDNPIVNMLDLDTIIDYDSIVSPTPLVGIFTDKNYDEIEDPTKDQVIELGGSTSRFRLAYGTQEQLDEDINRGIIPPGTLILVEDTQEIYLYTLESELHRYTEKYKFDSLEEAESWIGCHECAGEILSVKESDRMHAYIVDEEEGLIQLANEQDISDIDKNYTHSQMSASDTWEVNHNLKKFPSVSVVDSAGNLVVGDVHYINENQLVINFKGAFSGKCYCN